MRKSRKTKSTIYAKSRNGKNHRFQPKLAIKWSKLLFLSHMQYSPIHLRLCVMSLEYSIYLWTTLESLHWRENYMRAMILSYFHNISAQICSLIIYNNVSIICTSDAFQNICDVISVFNILVDITRGPEVTSIVHTRAHITELFSPNFSQNWQFNHLN